MFNFMACSSCKKSSKFNGVATGCISSECKYEPIETRCVSSTTSHYVALMANNKTEKEQKNG